MSRITVDTGLLKTVENDCYMYKVQDVTHSASLGEKLESNRSTRSSNHRILYSAWQVSVTASINHNRLSECCMWGVEGDRIASGLRRDVC